MLTILQNTFLNKKGVLFRMRKKNGILRLPVKRVRRGPLHYPDVALCARWQDYRGDASPKPQRPWRSRAWGQQKTIDKRVLRIFGSKPFLLSFCFLCCMKRKMCQEKMYLSASALKLLTNLSVSCRLANKKS